MSLIAETELSIPNTKHPIFITVDASLIGLGAVLFELNEDNKMKVISYNSRIINPQELKLFTLDRELLGIIRDLSNLRISHYWFPPSDPRFHRSQTSFTLFYKKGYLSPRFYRPQMQLTKFSKLKIIHTPEKTFLLLICSVVLLLKLN